MILQAEQPEGLVIATGITTTVRDIVRLAFGEVGIELELKREEVDDKAFATVCNDEDFQVGIGKEVLSIDPPHFRLTEADLFIGRLSKANNKLGWVSEYEMAPIPKT